MIRSLALAALCIPDPYEKVRATHAIAPSQEIDAGVELTCNQDLPGKAPKPELVEPNALERRSMRTPHGRAALIHGLAHIELNAVNLALDAVWRFAHQPQEFYLDWLRIAQEEAYHFGLLSAHLQSMGYAYGDFPAHNGLWDMTHKTRGDILARMALVPRTLEARGLDASIPIRNKLVQAGDSRAGEIIDIILRDEIGHVAVGNRWYAWHCAQRGLDPIAHYPVLCEQYQAPILKPPFNVQARLQAGFSMPEIQWLEEQAQSLGVQRTNLT